MMGFIACIVSGKMKTADEVKKSIRVAEWMIERHREQMGFNSRDDFDIDKIIDYSEKIKLLEVEIQALKWVLGE